MPRPLLLFGAAIACCAFAAEAKEKDADAQWLVIFAGGAHGDATSPTLVQLKERLDRADAKHTVVVFTGNYMTGELPLPGDPARAQAERDLKAHVAATQDLVGRGGRVFYLPGDTDFGASGSDSARRLRKFLNHAYADAKKDADDDDDDDTAKKIDVMPKAACGEPAVVELGDEVAIALLNSQWWTQDWQADPRANDGCDLMDRAQAIEKLHHWMLEYRTHRLIVASHHPIKSYGPLGGAFGAKEHLWPLPIAGTAWVLARQTGLVEQYRNHPMVLSYVDAIYNEGQRNGRFVYVSGHDASQQWVDLKGQYQLITGTTGRDPTDVVTPEEGDFAAARPGWVELAMDAKGDGTATFVSGTPIFTRALPDRVPNGPDPQGPPPPLPPGPVTAGYSKHEVWKLGSITQFFAGSFYADAYALKQPYPVLDLEARGLKPDQIGGGFQTNGLRLVDAQGGQWAMRSTTKESSRLLPYPYNGLSPATRLLDHGQTASHPEAALAASKLAHTVGVLAPDPELLYLPDQERLGPYRGYISDEVVLLERRPKELAEGTLPETLVGPPSPNGPTKFRSTEDLFDKLFDKPAKHQVNQREMLRARLLDVFLADWDRHLGQWRWAVTPDADGRKIYRPIARDRDQAFGNYDGVGLWFARISSAERRVLQPFSGKYGSIGWLTFAARNLDPVLLNRLTHDEWRAVAEEVKAALTDDAIDRAFAGWHAEAYQLHGAKIVAALKERRDTLIEAADAFYAQVARTVDIPASRKDDVYDVWFLEGGRVRVTVRDRKDAAQAWYDRSFEPDETDELRLYAMEGDDWLFVHGAPHRAITIRYVGGEGADVVAAARRADAVLDAPALQLYDAPDGARIDASIDVTDERSNVAQRNQYDPNADHDLSYGFFIPGLMVNPDDGLFLGGKFTWLGRSFRTLPYGAQHDLSAYFATATLGAAVDYRGVFPESVAMLDQQVDLELRTPTYTRNFYGLTNTWVADGDEADDYRVRQARYGGRYGLSKTLRERTRVGLQLTGIALVTQLTPTRFVAQSSDVTPDVFGPKYYAGARLFAETNTFDSPGLPRRGVALHVSADSRYDVGHGNKLSTNYKVAGALAVPFDRAQRFVLLTRAAVEGIVGEHAFFFAPTLGEQQLRAYHREQFAGDLAVSHSTDLRIDVFRIQAVIPGTIGVNLSVDHGRVFGAGIASTDYHLSIGGGVWWSVLDVFGVSFAYHRSIEGASRFSLVVGPLFSQTGF